MARIDDLRKIATRLRIHSLRMTTVAGSGHPTTCLSAADLAACLFFSEMRWNTKDPNDPAGDEFVLSKGHAAPLLWAAYAEAGVIPLERLLDLRKITSDLEGHPTPRMPWVKAATGSLGQGLSVGAGMALAQRLDKSPARTFVLMGDGECAEGQVWEAAADAAGWKLRNLVAVVDVNRLGQSDPTMHQHDLAALARKFRAFGWDDITVDGHKIDKVLAALKLAGKKGRPTVILARTLKGKGVSFIEDRNGWHGKPLKADELARALEEIGCLPDVDSRRFIHKPKPFRKRSVPAALDFPRTAYTEKTATRMAYGNALLSLGKVNPRVVAIDGDVKNSTYADKFFEAFPGRSFQSFIAEQNMAGVAMGLAAKGFIPFMATFAAFLTRAHDQIRMAAYSFSNLKVCGSHVGVSIGEDGPSQMGLEDLAMFRPIPGCVVLYPSDAVSSEACVAAAAAHKGLCLHPDVAASDADPLSRRRDLLHRRLQGPEERGGGRGHGHRRRDHRPRSPQSLRCAQEGGHRPARHRRLFASSPWIRRRSSAKSRQREAGPSSSKIITPPAGWEKPWPVPWRDGPPSLTSAFASCPVPGSRTSSWTGSESAPRTSSER